MASSRQSTPPLHRTISAQIRAWIAAGKYQPGDRLPSEAQLMTQFAVSRITIRRALANLVQQGLAQSQHGKGVFITERQRAIYSLSSPFVLFDQAMVQQGLSNAVKTLVFKAVKPPAPVRQTLALGPEIARVYLQKKFLLIDQVAAALDVTYIVPDLGQALASELKRSMTFPVLEQHGISLDRIEAILSCRQADDDTATALGLAIGSPILVYEHTAYTRNNRPILCGETLSSGDRLAYAIALQPPIAPN
jgi:GntR family transcriptional regulator